MPYVTSHGVEIHYEVHGTGPALVFAHGAGGNALSWWQQIPHFARRYTAIAFDHRGFGRSRCAPADFLPERFPDDVFAVLDAAGVERAALVCQSMGGWTGLPAALRRPERVACLALCATPAGVVTEGVRAAFAARAERFRGQRLEANLALAPDFPEREPALSFLYAQIQALNPPLEPSAFARLGAVRIEPAALERHRTPTLLVACEHDQLFPPAAIHSVAAALPGSSVLDFAGVGHSSYFEDAPVFNRRIGEFVAQYLD